MNLTWFDANSWLIEAAGNRILVDPWLVGDLIFGNLPWLVRGVRSHPASIPDNIDLILLSQGLADHAHPPTLALLDKAIPVVASPDGADVAKQAGFQRVIALGHGNSFAFSNLEGPNVEIQAFVGAPVGPTKKENAYVLHFLSTGTKLYYEPHGYPDAEHLQTLGSVDIAITPMADQTLLGVAPVIRGSVAAPRIAELLSPRVMLPTAEAGRVAYEGLIAPTLTTKGGADAMRSLFGSQGKNIQVIQPISEETIELDLQPASHPA
ncbi:MAG: MBL fold metallo-hydrolase [Cyanobacteria bacterium J06626_6]